jgi:hypothetical protein
MTQYAKFKTRSAFLCGEFGAGYARRLFGEEVVDALPRFVRGKNVGRPKGMVEWIKCEEGGWIKTGPAGLDGSPQGFVERRAGSVVAAVLRDYNGKVIATHGDPKYLYLFG